jgi:hypothetical protein
MARFCTHCGRPVREGDLFCESCGTRLNTASAAETPRETPPVGQYAPPYPPAMPTPEEPKKKKHGWIIALIAALVLAAAAAIVLFVTPGFLKAKDDAKKTEDSETVLETKEPEETKKSKKKKNKETETETESETESETEPLPDSVSDFEKYGIKFDLEVGKPVDYTTCCYDDESIITTGTLTVRSYTRSPITDAIIEFGEENDIYFGGYEQLTVSFDLSFDDENVIEYGISPIGRFEDYYNIDLLDDTAETFTDSYGETYTRYEIEYEGERQYVYIWNYSDHETEENHVDLHIQRTYLVPSGYDGVVVGFMDASKLSEEDHEKHIYEIYNEEDYHLIRLD